MFATVLIQSAYKIQNTKYKVHLCVCISPRKKSMQNYDRQKKNSV